MVKWIWLTGYPEGIPFEEGEKWVLGVHAQEVKRIPGVRKYLSWKVLDVPERPSKFARVMEVWYDDLESWRHAPRSQYITSKEPWEIPLLTEPVCVDEKPEYDLLREIPRL